MNSDFARRWAELLPIGRESTTGAYRRFTFSPAHRACEEWFGSTARELGLGVECDRNGNVWAWWEGAWGDRHSPGQLLVGSHLDSVPDGGAFDGPLGVVAAFAAIEELQRRGRTPRSTIGVVAFAEEEGARFGVACAGSRLLTGALAPERARRLTDASGTTWAEAMSAAGGRPDELGAEPERLDRVAAYLELHIEQGLAPVAGRPHITGLDEAGSAIGLGTHIWPHGRWRLRLAGRADHAGTTPLELRADALLEAARFVQDARSAAEHTGSLATVGRLQIEPNGTNAIPSRVTAWLDARADHEASVFALLEELGQRGWTDLEEESWTPAVHFDEELLDRASGVLGNPPRLGTGAGHDAGILALAGIPAVMVFVRNRTGTSHSPEERAELVDCEAGVAALVDLLDAGSDFGRVSPT
jgi:N-carbamoyl-L-amino-acid hydrolase